MSISAAASLTPLNGLCLRHARTGLLSVRIQSRSASLHLKATVALHPGQRRWQSDLPDRDAGPDRLRKQSQHPKPTVRQLLGRLLTAALRNFAYITSPQGFRQMRNDHPVAMPFAMILFAIFSAAVFSQIILIYRSLFNPELSKFPGPVADILRHAIYYTTIKPDPRLAHQSYMRALEETEKLGMDPMSDEVLGIRIMVAFSLEKGMFLKESAVVLESVRTDCLNWVETMDQQAKDGKIGPDGRLKIETPAADTATAQEEKEPGPIESEEKERVVDKAQEDEETQWKRRERLLKKAVSVSVKLGEIYADPHVLEPDQSHHHLIWAVETTLKEFRRRDVEGPKPGEESWLTPAEVGGTMESLGRAYERKSQFHLAIPLFFQGLRTCDSPCHRAVLMNNLSACFAQHPIYSPAGGGVGSSDGDVIDSPEAQSLKVMFDSSMPNTRKDCLEAAANWARNAYVHGRDVKGDDRTPECDEACAVALCNWGDVAAMQGKTDLARKKYNQSIEMSTKLDFTQGIKKAREGLKMLNNPPPPKNKK